MRDYSLVRYRGKWAVAFQDGGTTRRRSCGTADKALAEKVKVGIIAALEKPEDTKVSTLWEKYRDARSGRRIAESMGFTWRKLQATFGDLETEAVTPDKCREYADKRRRDGKAEGTIWTELNHLRIVMNWAKKEKLIQTSPTVVTPSQPAPLERYLTRAEFDRLWDGCSAPHMQTALALMIATAARIEAVLELTWDRVDFERGLIHLHNPFVAKKRKGRAVVPINDDLRAALSVAKMASRTEYVVEYGGERVKSIRTAFSAAVRRAGLSDDVTPHVLRHTAAVWMAEGGTAIEEIAQYMGHENTETTRKVYARFSPTYLRGAAATLSFRS